MGAIASALQVDAPLNSNPCQSMAGALQVDAPINSNPCHSTIGTSTVSGRVFGSFGFPVERNVGLGAMISVVGNSSQSEQNGHCKLDMEYGPHGNSEARYNNGNSEKGKAWGGNNVDRNGDPAPVKSWKNLFSVPTKSNG